MTDIYKTGALVSAEWLNDQLKTPDHNIRLLDASDDIITPGRDDYVSKHIPGAVFYDQTQGVTPTPLIPMNIPDPEAFTRYMRSIGVSTNSRVIFYDRYQMISSARNWWLLRAYGHPHVSVLDGGFTAWETAGHEVVSGESQAPPEGDFTAQVRKDLVRDYVQICDNRSSCSEQLLDSRLNEDFKCGKEPTFSTVFAVTLWKQPMPERLLPGHIPGALNLPYVMLYSQPDKHNFKDAKQLEKLFVDAGVDLTRPLVTTCYIGYTACLLALAAAVIGRPDTAVYYGSWTEYGQRAEPENIVTAKESEGQL